MTSDAAHTPDIQHSSAPPLPHRKRPGNGHGPQIAPIHVASAESAPPTTPRRKGTWTTLIVVVLGIVLCGVGTSRLTRRAPAKPITAAPAAVLTVDVQPASFSSVPETLIVTGTISAWDPLTIGAEVSGLRIDAIPVDEGHLVARGQLLALLDSSVLQAQLAQQQARLAASLAAARKAVQPNRPQDIEGFRAGERQARAVLSQEQANLDQARANLANARINANRYQKLVQEGFATQQEAENRALEFERSQAGVAAAQQRIAASRYGLEQAHQKRGMAEVGGREEDIQIAVAGTAETRAIIQQLQAQIAQTVIRAPDDGLIIKRDAHIGDITSPGKSLFTMVRSNRLELRAQVPQVDLPRVHVGSRVTISHASRRVTGQVREITPFIDPQSRVGTARIDVPASAGLMPGMFVQGVISAGLRKALVVPSSAVLGQSDAYFVFIFDGDGKDGRDGKARKRSVRAGQREGDRVEITDGLKGGDRIIISGGPFLADGDTVAVKMERTTP